MKRQETDKTLLIGIGNSARQDDGLGWAFLEEVEKAGSFNGDVLYKFQLNLEDAEVLFAYKRVYFIDAMKGDLEGGYSLNRCVPEAGSGFSTHMLAPASTLYLCQELYSQVPEAWVIAIQGYEWELQEGLSPKAKLNLEHALTWFKDYLKKSDYMMTSPK
jgi:hydrogenase maturation protease